MLRPALVAAVASALPGQPDTFHGFPRTDATVEGCRITVVRPTTSAPGRPWIWRARFFGHEPQTERALLERGFHVVYVDVGGLFGSAVALKRFDVCYRYATTTLSLHARPALLGMSRGGLVVLRWAAARPERVACIYLDAPVCDIGSWPGGKGAGKGSAGAWRACLAAHGLDEARAATWDGNPIHPAVVAPLAQARVPVLSVCGDADDVVPLAENTEVFASRYRQRGGPIRVIRKPGIGHHPHSLRDPAPIVAFVLRHTVGSGDYFVLRSGLARCGARFAAAGRARVAFLGGSITHNPGWRDLVEADLRRRFKETEFAFVNAGIPSFGSTPGAFRLQRDVLRHGGVDLLFVEAAVNDSTNGRTPEEMTRGMEGIVRHVRREQPRADIVMLHFVDPQKMVGIDRGVTPTVIARHEAVAERYAVASLDLATEVTERIAAGEFTWKDDFKDLHPAPFGQKLYAASIGRLFDAAWARPPAVEPPPHGLPAPIDPASYERGRLVEPGAARDLEGFAVVPSWRPADRAGTRPGFVRVPMAVAEAQGAGLRFSFTGRAVGVVVAAGPDAGQLEYTLDGGAWQRVELFTRWSRGLHLPWTHVLAHGLAAGEHELRLRVGQERHPRSRGHAVRIAWFLVDGG